jgi:tricarboxylate carrier
VPKFTTGATKYDQTQYIGRLRAVLEAIDPRTLLIDDAELQRCQRLLLSFKESGDQLAEGVTDADMWSAQNTVNAIIHKASGDKMFAPGRMSAFVLLNIPIAIGMIVHGPSGIGAAMFWQWSNQSANAMVNHVNRGAKEVDMVSLMQSYALAVGAACSIAYGSGKMMKRVPGLARLGPFIPFLAVAFAGSCNVAFTRMGEITNGVEIRSHDGELLGKSKVAGKLAVAQTVGSRCLFLPVFPLLMPPTIMSVLKMAPGPAKIAVEVTTIALCMGLALPAALALLPQRMEIPAANLEPEFQQLRDGAGNAITHVYADKGL